MFYLFIIYLFLFHIWEEFKPHFLKILILKDKEDKGQGNDRVYIVK